MKLFALPLIQKSCAGMLLALFVLSLWAPLLTHGQNNNAPVGETVAEGNAAAASIGVGRPNSVPTVYDDGILRASRGNTAPDGNAYTISNDGSTLTTDESTGNNGNAANGSSNSQSSAPADTGVRQSFNPELSDSLLANTLYNLMTGIGGVVVWVGGNILDYAIDQLVLGFGRILTQNFGVAVEQIWTIVRDFFNIIFIFVLIYMGLRTILFSDDSGVQRNLGMLILAALLINFSLFITKAIVDFSNIAAVQIADSLRIEVPKGSGFEIPGPDFVRSGLSDSSTHVSVAFAESMKLSSFAAEAQTDQATGKINKWRLISFGFLAMIIMLIAGFVFLAGGLLLIIRFVTLVLAMMFSPIMFLGWIYPDLKQFSKKWWGVFLRSAFVAPAYLFMLYIVLLLVGDQGAGLGTSNGVFANPTFAAAYGSQSVANGNFSVFLYFGVIIAMLIAAAKTATFMSAAGASTVEKAGMFGANFAYGRLRAVGRGARSAGMMPVNYGKRVGQNAGAAAARNFGIGVPGTSYGVGGKFTKRSYDNLKAARARKAAGIATATDKAALAWHGMRGAGSLDDRQADLKRSLEAKPFGGKSRQQIADSVKEQAKIGARTKAINDLTTKINSGDEAKTQEAFATMSNAQLIEIAQTKDGQELLEKNGAYLSDGQMKAIAENDNFNDEKVADFARARNRETKKKLTQDNRLELKKATKEDLSVLGVEELTKPQNAIQLSEDKIKSLNLVDAYKDQIREARNAALTNVITTKQTIGEVTFDSLKNGKPADVANLPDAVFKPDAHKKDEAKQNVQEFISGLNPSQLNEIANKKDNVVTQTIRKHVANTNAPTSDWLNNDPRGRYFGT